MSITVKKDIDVVKKEVKQILSRHGVKYVKMYTTSTKEFVRVKFYYLLEYKENKEEKMLKELAVMGISAVISNVTEGGPNAAPIYSLEVSNKK